MSLARFGLKAEGIAKKHINRQDLGWRPLDPATLAQKIRAGHSENILVATSSYFQSITSWVFGGQTALAGVKRSARNEDGELLANIAAVQEFGSESAGIPARPLWKPTYEETMEWHVTNNLPSMYFMAAVSKY
jgi:hypothetical protein